jgi:hypothetical protein
MSEKLIELITGKLFDNDHIVNSECCGNVINPSVPELVNIILSVIRQNVHLVARVCEQCGGCCWDKVLDKPCEFCKGHGIISKQERGEG